MRKIVTTTTLCAFEYNKGVICLSDTHASYGSFSKYHHIERIFQITSQALVGCSGDYADIQFFIKSLKLEILQDARPLSCNGLHKLVQRILYTHRSEMKVLNVSACIFGINAKELHSKDTKEGPFLSFVNFRGNFWKDSVVGFGMNAAYLVPFLRERVNGRVGEIEREEAIEIMKEAARLAIYRDCTTKNGFVMSYVEKDNVVIGSEFLVDTKWEVGQDIVD